MQISFWSSVHGQTATTSNTMAIGIMTALEYRFKVLLTHNHFDKSTLETSLFDRRYLKSEIADLSDTGVDALRRYVKFNKVEKDAFLNYTTTVLKNRLDVLMGTTNTNRDLYMKDLTNLIDTMLISAKDCYDLLLIDLSSGDNDLSKKVLDTSDLIVVNLNQNLAVLEDYFKNYPHLQDKSFYLMGMYDYNSRYNLKWLRRKYHLTKNIGVVPYCREFADYCNEGKVIDFFIRNLDAKKDDNNYLFINELRNTTKLMLTMMGIDINLKKLGD